MAATAVRPRSICPSHKLRCRTFDCVTPAGQAGKDRLAKHVQDWQCGDGAAEGEGNPAVWQQIIRKPVHTDPEASGCPYVSRQSGQEFLAWAGNIRRHTRV